MHGARSVRLIAFLNVYSLRVSPSVRFNKLVNRHTLWLALHFLPPAVAKGFNIVFWKTVIFLR
jgi:hypothetical protein